METTESTEWCLFRSYDSYVAAEVVSQQLNLHNVLTLIQEASLENGLSSRFELCVPTSLLHRARWLVNQLPASDAELRFLATGELPTGD